MSEHNLSVENYEPSVYIYNRERCTTHEPDSPSYLMYNSNQQRLQIKQIIIMYATYIGTKLTTGLICIHVISRQVYNIYFNKFTSCINELDDCCLGYLLLFRDCKDVIRPHSRWNQLDSRYLYHD